MGTLLFVDVETTGLPPEGARADDVESWPRLVQIAWRIYELSGRRLEKADYIVRPDGFEVPKASTAVHGISHDAAMQHGRDLREVLQLFAAALGDADHLVGHNIAFDQRVLAAEYQRLQLPSRIEEVGVVCTMAASAAWCQRQGNGGKWPSLDELFRLLFGRTFNNKHSATADVAATVKCFWKLVGLGEIALDSLGDASGPDSGQAQEEHPSASRTRPRRSRRTSSARGNPAAGFFIDEVHRELRRRLADPYAAPEEGEQDAESAAKPRGGLQAFYDRVCPFRIDGLSLRIDPDEVDPEIAVAHNYVSRGVPTRASLWLSANLLSHACGDAYLGRGPSSSSVVDLLVDSSFWEDVDDEVLREAFEQYPDVGPGEVASRYGTKAFYLVGLCQELVWAAHIEKTLLLVMLAGHLPTQGQVKVAICGLREDLDEIILEDLNELLGYIYRLRHGARHDSPQFVAPGSPQKAHLIVRGYWGDHQEGPDAHAEGVPVVTIYRTDGAQPDGAAWDSQASLVTTASLAYPQVGVVRQDEDEGQQVHRFHFHEPVYEESLRYFLQNAFRKMAFRPGQLAIINRALQGLDVIGLLPTGGGKSLTYQLCGLLQPGITVVVDPINSLMRDQYDKLVEHGITATAYINSFNSHEEREANIERLTNGQLLFVFMSPERFQIQKSRAALSRCFANGHYFSYAVIDEAHCVSEWGHDFRHSYLHLADNLKRFCRPRGDKLPLFGLTATASFDVLADVQRELGVGEETIVTLPPEAIDRDELNFRILPIEADVSEEVAYWERERQLGRAKYDAIEDFIRQVPKEVALLSHGDALAMDEPSAFFAADDGEYDKAGVIFCPTKSNKLGNGVLSVRYGYPRGPAGLVKRMPFIEPGVFFGGADDDTIKDTAIESEAGQSLQNQQAFVANETNLMIATKAFGMGIDKPNIRFTLHYAMPSSVEGFYQEAGRAGRDGSPSLCSILYHPADLKTNEDFFENAFKGRHRERAVVSELLEEVRYEKEFFVGVIASKMRDQLQKYVRLNLFPNGPGEDPFLLYINGSWHDDPSKRVSYGCLKLQNLRSFKPRDTIKNVDDQEARRVMDLARKLIEEGADVARYDEYLTRTHAPGIEALIESDPEKQHRLTIGFTNDIVDDITKRLKEVGNHEMEPVVVRAAYRFCDDAQDFISNLQYQYGKKTSFRCTLTADQETQEYLAYAFVRIRNTSDTQRAIYRLSILGVVDDYVIDYAANTIEVSFRAKSDEAYRDNLRAYLRRYLGVESTEELLARAASVEERSALRRYYAVLVEFIYDEVAAKRRRAISYMREVCELGIEKGERAFRDSIVYYFTSKYARLEYLPEDLDYGKVERLDHVRKYIEFIFDPPDGLGGQIDNAKHLRGACARLQIGQTGQNATLDVLNAFSLFALHAARPGAEQDSLDREMHVLDEAVRSYQRGFRRFMGSAEWGECRKTIRFFYQKICQILPAVEPTVRRLTEELLAARTLEQLKAFNERMGL